MIWTIIWIIGLVLAIKAALEIWGWSSVSPVVRLLVIVLVLITSWIGLLVYYLWGKNNLPAMLK
ncbi:MAG: hypothetical protein LBM06_02285 [Prevotellaceae bacterium]|jgi:hypothetical protein|nr:hypothetical protein [Prevotellaceae bacterium]